MVTQFARPCLLSEFWHIFCHSGPPRSLTSGCPRLPSEQTLTVSHFFRQKAESVPSGVMSPISQPVSPLSRPTSQCTCPTLVSQVTGNNGGRSERQKLKLLGGTDGQLVTQDVLISISREIDWWELYNTKNKHTRRQKLQIGPASDDSWMSSIRDSWEPLLSHSIAHLRDELVAYFLFISPLLYIVAYGESNFEEKKNTFVQSFQGKGATTLKKN